MASPICADAAPPLNGMAPSASFQSLGSRPMMPSTRRPIHVLHHQSEVTARDRGARRLSGRRTDPVAARGVLVGKYRRCELHLAPAIRFTVGKAAPHAAAEGLASA